jgi:hypothetical protein
MADKRSAAEVAKAAQREKSKTRSLLFRRMIEEELIPVTVQEELIEKYLNSTKTKAE